MNSVNLPTIVNHTVDFTLGLHAVNFLDLATASLVDLSGVFFAVSSILVKCLYQTVLHLALNLAAVNLMYLAAVI